MTTYKIIRFFADQSEPREEIKTGLTLEEAQAHCADPETSSRTATGSMKEITKTKGPWFDGYEEE